MANWNLPTVTSGYLDFVAEMNAKFVDAGTFGYGAPTNLPVHAMRFNRSVNAFEEWDGAVWTPKVIGITSGGTGASDAANARINLGIGSMGTQNSNAVAITGGTMTGVALDAGYVTTGVLPLARGGTGSSLAIAPYGQVLFSNGSIVHFVPGEYINRLDANALVMGNIPLDRNTPGTVNGNYPAIMNSTFETRSNTIFAGPSGPNTVRIDSNYATLHYVSQTAPAGRKIVREYNENGNIHIQRVDDAYSVAYDMLMIYNEGHIQASGYYLTNLQGAAIAYGYINPSVMGQGAANAGTFLRGDGVWAVPSLAPVDPIPSGLIAIFDTGCPVGWTRVAALDNRFPIGSTVWGSQGGSSSHQHSVSGNTDSAGGHSHGVSVHGNGNLQGNTDSPINEGGQGATFNGGNSSFAPYYHSHHVNINFGLDSSGSTDNQGNHAHSFSGFSNVDDHYPPYCSVIFCRKN